MRGEHLPWRERKCQGLIAQIEPFILWKLLSQLIDRQDEFTRTLVNFKVSATLDRHLLTSNFQPLISSF
jgi:hypothetical protein